MSKAAKKESIPNARAREQPAAVWLRPDELVPWERNPRVNAAVVAKVADSIQRFGFSSPIVARAQDHRIIAGHTRWKAALQLGLDGVPVRLMELPERDAELLALADNRLNELAQWDMPELQRILSEYDLADVAVAGWSSEDLEKMAAAFLPTAEDLQGQLDQIQGHLLTCPSCGHEFKA